ncbi:hypothetical protein EMCRGX_G014792 [Ephydatia muelleri]
MEELVATDDGGTRGSLGDGRTHGSRGDGGAVVAEVMEELVVAEVMEELVAAEVMEELVVAAVMEELVVAEAMEELMVAEMMEELMVAEVMEELRADLQIMGLTHILLLVEVFSFLEANEIPNQRCVLNILSILPYPSTISTVVESDGPDMIPAGYLALEIINNRSDILEDYHLELIDGQAGCGAAVLELSERVLVKEVFYSEKNIVGLVGPRCYDSAERVGLVTAKDGIALVNIHTSSASILGNATLYPYSLGTSPSILRLQAKDIEPPLYAGNVPIASATSSRHRGVGNLHFLRPL